MGSRFGNKEVLLHWAGISQYLDFNVMPGVQTEIIGKKDYFNDFFVTTNYIWNEHVANKLTKPERYYHLGASPFVYADALIPDQVRRDVGIFLPKHDESTRFVLENFCYGCIEEIKSTTDENVYAIAPAGAREAWEEVFKIVGIDIKVISICDDAFSSEWQFGTAVLLGRLKSVYFPLFSTAVLTAYHSGTDVGYYDPGDIYENIKKESVIDSTAELTDVHKKLEQVWLENMTDCDVIMSLVKLFLCPHKRQSPQNLAYSLYMLNFESNRFTYAKRRMIDDFVEGTKCSWIDQDMIPFDLNRMSIAQNKLYEKCKDYDKLEYHPAVAELIPLL